MYAEHMMIKCEANMHPWTTPHLSNTSLSYIYKSIIIYSWLTNLRDLYSQCLDKGYSSG